MNSSNWKPHVLEPVEYKFMTILEKAMESLKDDSDVTADSL